MQIKFRKRAGWGVRVTIPLKFCSFCESGLWWLGEIVFGNQRKSLCLLLWICVAHAMTSVLIFSRMTQPSSSAIVALARAMRNRWKINCRNLKLLFHVGLKLHKINNCWVNELWVLWIVNVRGTFCAATPRILQRWRMCVIALWLIIARRIHNEITWPWTNN